MPKLIVLLSAGLVCAVLLCQGGAWARPPVDDGFATAKKIEARYFSVFLAPGVDAGTLVQSLNIGSSHKIIAGQTLAGEAFSANSLGDLLDALFLWVSGVLDMNLYSYRGSIKVVRSDEELKDIFRKLYGAEGTSRRSFYIYDLNTVYISADGFTKEILGHEFGHAVTSNFFVVQPPEKVAEVLSGYIEFQLRKLSRSEEPLSPAKRK